MIPRPSDYATAPSYDKEMTRLAPGAYICEVKNLIFCKAKNDKLYVKIALDIAEGEHAGIYMKRYNAQKASANGKQATWGCSYNVFVENKDGGTNPHYKGFFTALEDSNPDFKVNWNGDETQFRGKKVGILFREEDFLGNDGKVHTSVKPCAARAVETVRSGECKIPAKRKLNGSAEETSASDSTVDAETGYAIANEELPF